MFSDGEQQVHAFSRQDSLNFTGCIGIFKTHHCHSQHQAEDKERRKVEEEEREGGGVELGNCVDSLDGLKEYDRHAIVDLQRGGGGGPAPG